MDNVLSGRGEWTCTLEVQECHMLHGMLQAGKVFNVLDLIIKNATWLYFFLLQYMSVYPQKYFLLLITEWSWLTMESNDFLESSFKTIYHVFPMESCVLWHTSLRISDVDERVLYLENEAWILILPLSVIFSLILIILFNIPVSPL